MVSRSTKILLQCVCAVTVIKILMMRSYHSTDFEVHRNWLAITHSLPVSQWYYENTSEWTLDYPPFFAWFEYILSFFAKWFDPEMLKISNLNYASENTVLFQRLSVEITDLVLICTLASYFGYSWKKEMSTMQIIGFALCIFAPGFLIVDHIHFQYNGYLIGLYILSIVLLIKDHPILAAFCYSFTMNSKHLFCFQAPFFLIYLLRTYCLQNNHFRFNHFVQLGLIVLSTFFISLYPILRGNILPNLQQFLSRLFPFQRGLIHSYWAPNVWAMYAGLDKVLSVLAQKHIISLTVLKDSNTTNGLVGNVTFSVLPEISSIMTILLLLASFIPLLWKLWKSSTSTTFIRCSVAATFLYFLLGWHVHEKAILPTIILAGMLIPISVVDCKIFFLLSLSGTIGLFPLLFTTRDIITEFALSITYYIICWYVFDRFSQSAFKNSFSLMDKAVILLLISACCFSYGVFPLLEKCSGLPFKNLPFLPLMVISVSCALSNCYVFVLCIRQLFKQKVDYVCLFQL